MTTNVEMPDPSPSELPVFDLGGELPAPAATTLLEASAGTGKTYTIAGLVARYLASGAVRIEEVLVVTFGRAASQELRARVRERLVDSERALADPEAVADGTDVVRDWLLACDPVERAERHDRLRTALAGFDAATIATTHQFCQQVLRSLGVAGDTEPGATLVDSLDDLVTEVVDDVYLRFFGERQTPPPFTLAIARTLARDVMSDSLAALAPPSPAEAADPDAPGGLRVAFAHQVRVEVDRRKRERGILSYDDLLVRVARALADDDAPARARLRSRWRVVLVDEFQDTDPTQWEVLERAFHEHATLVLIGDPKQAIYGFRGGDVVTYLRAAGLAHHRATLGFNHRSDAALVDALQVMLGNAALGESEIVVRPVRARIEQRRLEGAPSDAPVRLRRLPREGCALTRKGEIRAADAREAIAADCAADIAELLAARPRFAGRELARADIAVIVGKRDHGVLVQTALAALGIPAVVAGGGHLFATPAADAWLVLLEALEQPHRAPRVRAAALTCFLGHTATELAADPAAGEAVADAVADRLRGWAGVLRARGVAALVEALESAGLTPRVLGQEGGERLLTDLRHLGHLMHETAVRERMGLTALLQWFREERRRVEAAGGERPRRLDSDAAAVQIVTVHGSKGLQYPVTYLPFVYQTFRHPTEVARYHDAGVRTLDVRGAGVGWAEHLQRHVTEECGEDLRELYVALTRAQAQTVVWWAPTQTTVNGPLHRVLFGRRPGAAAVPDEMLLRDDAGAVEVLTHWAAAGALHLETAATSRAPQPPAEPEREEVLTVRSLTRPIDTAWTRTSYSGLIRIEEQGNARAASEPEVQLRDDEPASADADDLLPAAAPDAATDAEPALPMADAPAGATFGSLVHAVLEHADPLAPAFGGDLLAELRHHVVDQQRWWPVEVEPDSLAAALVAVHETPLGPLCDDRTLVTFPRAERLCELDFEIPLAGGDLRDRPAGGVPLLRDLAPLLREHLAADDPLAPYAARLEAPLLGDQPLRGYLSGSIDLILRVPDPAVGHRYVVADYKTNRLSEAGAVPLISDYAGPRLAEAMLHSHYPLQAMLYSVVLHRYLRWRVPAYRPETHLGGVLYLYLRGMVGAQTPAPDGHPAGVFSWRPPAALVVALSDLLDGAPVGAGGRR